MATSIPTFQICHSFPSSVKPLTKPLKPSSSSSSPCALDPNQSDNPPSPNAKEAGDTQLATSEPDSSFENRLSQVRLKYRSGTGKKAEQRRARRSPPGSSSRKAKDGVLLPPVPLREPVSSAGMKVDFGFSPYSEWLNGRLAALGLVALLLVEIGSGKGLLSYHTTPILFIQIYTVAAASALFIKYEKERISVWPERPSTPPSPSPASGE